MINLLVMYQRNLYQKERKMNNIILINGKKRSGKDYFATELQKQLYDNNKTSAVIAFADPIKEMVATLFNISLSDLDTYKNNPDQYGYAIQAYPNNQPICNVQYGDFRTILQRFGTETLKPWFGEDIWVKLLQNKSQELNVDYIIVPDFRFFCEEISDCTIHIKNDNCTSNDSHRSETELEQFGFEFKYTVDNTGYPDITNDVKAIVEDIIL